MALPRHLPNKAIQGASESARGSILVMARQPIISRRVRFGNPSIPSSELSFEAIPIFNEVSVGILMSPISRMPRFFRFKEAKSL